MLLDAKYEKEELHKVVETQLQHLIEVQSNELQNIIIDPLEHLAPGKQIQLTFN